MAAPEVHRVGVWALRTSRSFIRSYFGDMTEKKDDTDRRIAQYMRNGWAPVPFAHHPPHIRLAIRAARMRPKMKCCFENCIRLICQQQVVPLTYCEGFVSTAHVPFPIEHAWLKDEHGVVIDVTLGAERGVVILAHREYTPAAVRTGILRTRVFEPIDPEWFLRTQAEIWQKLSNIDPADLVRLNGKSAVTSSEGDHHAKAHSQP